MKNKRKGLAARYDHNRKTKDGGSNFGCFNYPSNTKFFKLKEGRNKLVIVPYKVKNKNHPLVHSGEIEIGDLDFVMDVYIHRSIGGGDQDVVCLKRNFNKRCPVCELANEEKEKGNEKAYSSLYASRRVFFNIVDPDDDDLEPKVFTMSHKYFMKPLTEEAEEGDDGGPIDYADPEDGKIITFRATEEKFGKNKYFECSSFKFSNREFSVTEEMINQAVSFDDVMKVLSAEEIEKILFAVDDDDDDEDEDDIKERRRNKDEDSGDSEKDDSRKSRKDRGRSEDDEEEEKEDRGKDKRKKSEDDEESGEDKRKKRQTEKECPSGHEFGKEVDKYKECDSCKCWDECDEARRASKKK